MMLPSSWRMDLTWGILDKGNALIKRLTSYLLRPRLMHLLRQTNDLWNNSSSLFQKKRVVIAPIIRPSLASVRIIKPSTALATPQPVSIPEPPERTTPQILLPYPPPERTTPQILLPDPPVPTTPQILLPDPPLLTTPQILVSDPPVPTTPQILLPDPPPVPTTPQILLPDSPVVKTLEPTFTDDSSVDQILSSVFGDYLPQGFPWRILKNLRCWTRCLPCLTRVMISSRFWIILKQGWPWSNKKLPWI
ncbi:hypothetical protein TNCV_3931781 [Trichonephila clavipes]|nr:hypothetical protein TNCV_3931781 [Trichonephila clavipes]